MAVRRAVIGVIQALFGAVATEGIQATQEAAFLSTGRLVSLIFPLQCAVQYVLACERLGHSPSELSGCWKSLVQAANLKDAEALVSLHAGGLIETLSKVGQWHWTFDDGESMTIHSRYKVRP